MNWPVLQQVARLLRLGDRGVDHASVLPLLEQRLWAGSSTELHDLYAAFCREMGKGEATHHGIMVVIPVADRPRQLRHCLESLLGAQRRFGYPGQLQLLVVEDSLDPANRKAHRSLVEEVIGAGLDAYYLGVEEQWGVLERWQARLPLFLGEQSQDQLGHKGASVTRNIAKLWLARQGLADTLFHFIDSDQVFYLEVQRNRRLYQLDHFGHIDRLFRQHDLEVLTGKVIGDPPVSPAVMAGTLLQDLQAICDKALPNLETSCCFHTEESGVSHGAYHDMARLFGLEAAGDFEYACPLPQPHSHRDVLRDLGGRLGRFFDGEHPTRCTPFTPTGVGESLAPARTVYTGNYVLNRAGLRHGIPFAPLKLRMAGPTLGRLLQARLGDRFVQANLPLLHRRTEVASGQAEYRPGVARHRDGVDLSDEYRRQFLGDWMLFTIADLAECGYAGEDSASQHIEKVLRGVEDRLLKEYRKVRQVVTERLKAFDPMLARWKNNDLGPDLDRFLTRIRSNYTEESPAVRSLEDAAFRDRWRAVLADAIRQWPEQQRAWEQTVDHGGPGDAI